MRIIDQIIDIVGSQAELARRLKIRPQSVHDMVRRGYVTLWRMGAVERIVKKEITVAQMLEDSPYK